MKKWLTWAVAGLMLVLLAGCAAGPGTDPILSSGIPRDKYLIGSGYSIDFKAPQDGTIYVVESSSGKTMMMKSLAAKESFDKFCGPGEGKAHDEELKAIGVERSKFAIRYYFVPAAAFPYAHTPTREKPAE